MFKKIVLLSFVFSGINTSAQPIIANGNNIPAVGFSAPLKLASPSSGIGNAGANQTWDFSSLSFTTIGTYNVISPSSSPIGGSFPTANYAYSMVGTYSFFNVSSTKMEVLAYSITSPGTGNDYTPDPRTLLSFPFNYQDVVQDTWQKVGGSQNTVTLTYDGYGTLITPTKTYANVVRIKEDYGVGAVDYQWFVLNPLMSVMVYDHNTNNLYSLDATVNSVSTIDNKSSAMNIFPNPAHDKIQLKNIQVKSKLKLTVLNILGETVLINTIDSETATVNIDNLNAGVYFYQLSDENEIINSGKIVIE